MKRIVFITLLVLSLLQINVFAGETKSMEDISKEMANPLAQIWNLSFQYNYTRIGGDLVDGNDHINIGVFQPVLPIPLGEKYTFFARPVITYIEGPTGIGITGGTPSNPIGHGKNRTGALGDIILAVGAGVVNKAGWSGGGGLTFIFPTSQNDLLGSHQYQAGLSGLVLWTNEDWAIGGFLQHWWGIANDNKSEDDLIIKAAHERKLSHTNFQYFLIRHLPNAWQLRASPTITFDWEASSGNKLTLPVGIGVGKMFKIGPMPVMLMAEYQYPVIAPDAIRQEGTIMVQAFFIIKNPFGDL